MTTDILTVTDLKKYFVIGHHDLLRRNPITVKAVGFRQEHRRLHGDRHVPAHVRAYQLPGA